VSLKLLMRCVITPLVILFVGASLNGLNAQAVNQPFRTDLTCVESMSVPQYDGLFWVTRVSGTARVLVNIGTDGTPTSVEVQSASNYLGVLLRSSFQDAKFASQCAGQTIEVNFIYELRGDPTPTPHNKTRLKNVNTFEVIANLPIPIPAQP
jgi:hypothetical protein